MITAAAPSSKSISHRYLIATALASGESELDNVLESDDTLSQILPSSQNRSFVLFQGIRHARRPARRR